MGVQQSICHRAQRLAQQRVTRMNTEGDQVALVIVGHFKDGVDGMPFPGHKSGGNGQRSSPGLLQQFLSPLTVWLDGQHN